MPLRTRVITATTTPVIIAASTVSPNSTAAFTLAGASLYDSVPIVLNNTSTAQTVYLGGSTISSASSNLGFPLAPGASMSYNLLASESLFCCTTNATVDLIAQAGRQN